MKEIKIKQLRLLNFKGIRNLTVNFDSNQTKIYGDNGTGKTSIFDAFSYLLFGKNSENSENFDLKTLDKNGRIIYRLPHEVEGLITVNGVEIRLTRRIKEKWVKQDGGLEEKFDGNEVEYLYNDIPCTKKEYTSKVAEICHETVFKQLTNPAFFCTQEAKQQKATLLKLAGKIEDSEVAFGNHEFEEFLKVLCDKKIEEFKKEINAKKTRIKNGIAGIPDRIDEIKRGMPADENWDELKKQLSEKEAELENIEGSIMDIAKRSEESDIAIRDVYLEISKIRKKISDREAEINREVNNNYEVNLKKWNELHQEILTHGYNIRLYEQKIVDAQKDLTRFESERKILLAEYKKIVLTIKEIEDRTVIFSEDDFRCPACGRVFEEDDIICKQHELQLTFNERKEKDKSLQKSYLDINLSKGIALKKKIDSLKISLKDYTQNKTKLEEIVAKIEADPIYTQQPKKVDISQLIEDDKAIISYNAEIVKLQKKTQRNSDSSSETTLLSADRKRIVFEIDSIKSALNKEAIIAKDNARILELETAYTEQSVELQRLSKLEYTMEEFSKEKNRKIEERINGMFNTVKFRWIKEQVNGIEKETCEACIDGIPYNSLNSAGKIKAGLDIINAICVNMQICAPIVIDNAESINEIPETYGQKILLVVSKDKSLKIVN